MTLPGLDNAPIMRTVVFLTATGLLVTVLGGGIYMGVLQQTVRGNERGIVALETVMTRHLQEATSRITIQEQTIDGLRDAVARLQTTIERLNADIHLLSGYVNDERSRQRQRLDRLEEERSNYIRQQGALTGQPSPTRSLDQPQGERLPDRPAVAPRTN